MVAANVVVKVWRTLALAAIVAALGTYIYVVERPRVADEQAGDFLLDLKPKEVTSITLRYPSTAPIRLERDGDGWRLREPLDFPADSGIVERLLDQIAETKVERRIKTSGAEPLATYGLDGDGQQARISLATSAAAKLPDLVVGRTTPVGYSAFVRLEGSDEIVVTPLIFHTGIKKTVLELRKKRLFEIDPTRVIAMRVGDGAGGIQMERRGDDWEIKAPIETRADAEQARALISSLNEIEALEFFDSPRPSDDVIGSGGLHVRATLAGGDEIGFRLGKPVDSDPSGHYLVRDSDGLVVKVEPATAVKFPKDVNTLRDKRLFSCEANDLADVRFERADGQSFALSQSGGQWTVTPAPADGTLRDNVVRRTVSGLLGLAGADVAAEDTAPSDLAAFGLDSPVVDVDLLRRDGSSCGRALAGIRGPSSETPAYYVKRATNGLVMTLPSYLFSRIDVRRDDLIEIKPAPAPLAPADKPE